MVEYARTISTDSRGVAGLVFPVRFVEAHCSLDELSVLFVFEAAVPSIRSYAMLALGPADVPDGIDNPSVIAPLTAGEFAAELSRDTWAACA